MLPLRSLHARRHYLSAEAGWTFARQAAAPPARDGFSHATSTDLDVQTYGLEVRRLLHGGRADR